MDSNNPFINTYIDTSSYMEKDILPLAKKYSKASGLPLNTYDSDEGLFNNHYDYLACVSNTYAKYKSLSGITVTSLLSHRNYIVNTLKAKQITEQDLDDYLESKQVQIEYPDFDFKISLVGMSEAEKVAAKQWIKEAVTSKFSNPAIKSLKNGISYFWAEDTNKGGMLHHTSIENFFKGYDAQEIKLTFSTVVTNWSKDQSELWQRKARLEETLAEINTELGLD